MHELQDLGEKLVSLSSQQLKHIELPERLRDAVNDARRISKHEARRRQMQFIGKLMRTADPEPIQAAIAVIEGTSQQEVARQHRLERLRERLLEDETTLTQIAAAHPGVDLQALRTLRRNALKERELAKPPKHFREIFRVLRELEHSPESGEPEHDAD